MPSLSPSRRVTPHSVKNLFASAPSVICPHFVLDPQYEGNVEVLVTVSFQVVDDASVLPEPTTNNRMELQAVIEALSCAEKEGHSKILLIFDSQYVVKIANVWFLLEQPRLFLSSLSTISAFFFIGMKTEQVYG